MPVFDASSMISAWDNYPLELFPGLWKWLGHRVATREIRLPRPALDEVGHKAEDCVEWLDTQKHSVINMNNEIVGHAFRFKGLLKIENDAFDPDGVDENDLLIIASALVHKQDLVSDEAEQFTRPKNLRKFKIPAVCKLGQINVTQYSFLSYIKRAGVPFR